jgi:hypothetical protein
MANFQNSLSHIPIVRSPWHEFDSYISTLSNNRMILSGRSSHRTDKSRSFLLFRFIQKTIVFVLAISRTFAAVNVEAVGQYHRVRSLYDSTGQPSDNSNEISWINRTLSFSYQLFLPVGLDEVVDDPAIDQVKQIERLVRSNIRGKARDIPYFGRPTGLSSKYSTYNHRCLDWEGRPVRSPVKRRAVVFLFRSPPTTEQCTRNEAQDHTSTDGGKSDCYMVNTTMTIPFDQSLDPIVAQQAALGFVQDVFKTYNSDWKNTSGTMNDGMYYSAEYWAPKFVASTLRINAIGLNRTVMNDEQIDLFVRVFRRGFQALLKGTSPMTITDVETLYQIPPMSRGLVNAMSSSNLATSARLSPGDPLYYTHLGVHLLVRATCSGVACRNDQLKDELWTKGKPHAEAWAKGIREQAAQSSINAIRAYFDPLVAIVFEPLNQTTSQQGAHTVYSPLSSTVQGGVPNWMWIVLGVDGLILFLALLLVLCRVSRRRDEMNGQPSRREITLAKSTNDSSSGAAEAIPEQYPSGEPYSRMRPSKEVVHGPKTEKEGEHDGASTNHGDEEFHDEGSDRIFDDGIRVREVQTAPDLVLNDSVRRSSEHVFDTNHLDADSELPAPVLRTEPSLPPPPPPSPTPHSERQYDAGTHISNAIYDID